MFNFSTLPPLSLYIHFPWCVRKCPYCDFNSHEARDTIPEQAYVDALIRDLEHDLPLIWGRRINSIFMGGGTPGLFSPESLNNLLSALRARVQFNPDSEITIEVNPGAADETKFMEYHSIGINRISIGVQSFDNACLQSLGRIHDADSALSAVEYAKKAGFENINLDLMFGLPGQSPQQAQHDIKTAVAQQVPHISYYQLTIEPNTLFSNAPPVLPVEDDIEQIHLSGQSVLQTAGYKQYEVSAYSFTGKECEHNQNYWRFGDYLGIGAGAHAKLSNANEQSITRYWKVRHPKEYLEKSRLIQAGHAPHIGGEKDIDRQSAGFEFMLNALRLTEGFESRLFMENTGLPLMVVENQLKQAKLQGLVDWGRDTIRPTERGKRYLNDLLQIFLPDSDVPLNNPH